MGVLFHFFGSTVGASRRGGAGLTLAVAGKVCQRVCVQVSGPFQPDEFGIPVLRLQSRLSTGALAVGFSSQDPGKVFGWPYLSLFVRGLAPQTSAVC